MLVDEGVDLGQSDDLGHEAAQPLRLQEEEPAQLALDIIVMEDHATLMEEDDGLGKGEEREEEEEEEGRRKRKGRRRRKREGRRRRRGGGGRGGGGGGGGGGGKMDTTLHLHNIQELMSTTTH